MILWEIIQNIMFYEIWLVCHYKASIVHLWSWKYIPNACIDFLRENASQWYVTWHGIGYANQNAVRSDDNQVGYSCKSSWRKLFSKNVYLNHDVWYIILDQMTSPYTMHTNNTTFEYVYASLSDSRSPETIKMSLIFM